MAHARRREQREQRQAGTHRVGCYHGPVIDSHCHLADETFASDLEQVVDRAKEAGLERALVILEGGNPKEAAQAERLERLLTETDSPFLAPVPYRGTRNEPAYVARVVAALADVHGMAAGELSARTAANFHRLFGP